jgi:hypothetical protein
MLRYNKICYEKKKAAAAYLRKPLRANYCQRCSVSLPGSGWIWVGPLRSCHDFLLCFIQTAVLLQHFKKRIPNFVFFCKFTSLFFD